MTKRISTKYKIDRRLGCNLWGRPKSPFNKRNSRPGQHGTVGQRRKYQTMVHNYLPNKNFVSITVILLRNNSEIYTKKLQI